MEHTAAPAPEPAPEPPVALVTGAAVRVGRSIASALARAGYRVWIHYYRSATEARSLHASLPSPDDRPRPPPVSADLGDADARRSLMATVLDPQGPAAGRLDLLVNSAASFERGPFAERSDEDLRRVLELNLVAPLSLARAAAPALARQRGSIVNILDLAGAHPWPTYLDHSTAKAGLWAATRGLALELPPVRVNGIAPGTVAWPASLSDPDERRAVEEAIPLGHIGTPEDVADTVLFLARSRHVTGQILAVDGGSLAAAGGRRP